MIALLASVAWADCPSRSAEVVAAWDRAEATFGGLDIDGFVTQTDALITLTNCLQEPVSPSIAAGLHRIRGVRAFVDQDREGATRSFAAARQLEPDYTWAPELLPAGHPIHALYTAFRPEEGAFEAVPAPKGVRLLFDGERATERPMDWPTLFQVVDRDGEVVTSAYVRRGEALPEYPAKPPPSPLTRPLWIAAGASAVLTASALTGAALSRGGYDRLDPSVPGDQARLDGRRSTTNALVVGAGVAGALTLGTTGWAAAVTRW